MVHSHWLRSLQILCSDWLDLDVKSLDHTYHIYLSLGTLQCTTLCRRYLAFNASKTFADTVKFCRALGGQIAVAEDEATLVLMKEAFSGLGPEASYFYSGHHLAQSGQWVDVNTGEPQLWQPWREGEPRADLHCSDFYLQRDGLDSTPCTVEETPICQLRPNSPQLHLTGLCPHSRADRFYIIEDSTRLFGLTGTSIIFSQGRWQIVLTVDHQQIIAVLNSSVDFPLGKHSWYFQEGNCQDPGETFRSLNLHLEVPQPGQFCCDSGHCLDSDLVCNNYPDCQDGSDEANCSIVKLPLFGYNSNLPVIEITQGKDTFLTLIHPAGCVKRHLETRGCVRRYQGGDQ